MRLAFTTFAILHEPYGHERVQEFDDLTPIVFREAEKSKGFIARAVDLDATGLSNFQCNWGPWGAFDVPRFYQLGRESCTDQRASTLSLWTDLQSVFNFAYSGLHLSALRKRAEWFKAPAWPTYACWWVEDKEIPTWSQACRKLEQLHDKGSTPQAFNFRQCFDAQGCLTQLERPTTA
jgi:hypothetical protein